MPDRDAEEHRLTEARNPRTEGIDRASPREIVELIQEEDRRVPEAVAEEADAIAALVEEVAARMRRGGRLFYVGAGTSGRLGVLDAAECPPTFGTDPRRVQGIVAGGASALVRSQEGAEDSREDGRAELRRAGVERRDFVLGIATSGTTPFVRAAVEEAARIGAGTGFLSCTPPPDDVREAADHLVTPLVGPEVVAGSTRMKAGTATKLVLNTLTTAVMIRRGKVYRNLMVDLRAVSRKLVERSLRIVSEAAGVGRPGARRALVDAGGSAKTAIAMLELEVGRAVAERALDACDGFLGRALDRWADADGVPYYGGYPTSFEPEEEADELLRALRRGPRILRRAAAEARSGGPPGRHGATALAGTASPEPAGGAPAGEDGRGGGSPGEAGDGPEASGAAAAGLRGTGDLGGWSTGEHLAHALECEEPAFRRRIRGFLEADAGELPAFPDWPPSDPPPGADRPHGELLRRLREERDRTLARLEGLPPDAWGRRAVVAGEEVALHQFLRGMAHHDRAHADRIAQWLHPDLLGAGEEG